MSYATREELTARLGPELINLLADDDGSGTPDEGVLDAALGAAGDRLDQRLGRRYVTPVDPAPAILNRWCLDLAVAELLRRRREAMPPEWAERERLTERALEAIEHGLAGLAGATARPVSLAAESTRRGLEPTFDDEALELY